MAVTKTPVYLRMLGKFVPGPGCWTWTASLNDGGYGQISLNGRPHRAHRVMYEWILGPIPEGMVIDHLCRNRTCVNPFHMDVVTRGENVRRGIAGRLASERAAEITHCKRGHEFTSANTYRQTLRSGSIGRKCRKCAAMRESARRANHGRAEPSL